MIHFLQSNAIFYLLFSFQYARIASIKKKKTKMKELNII